MPLQRAKSVDTLYEECKDYDLVLVPDPPLGDALNRRLEISHFGPFATTPRRLATGRRETAEDRLAFLDVVDNTSLGWKEAAHAIGNILQCWEHQGRADAILEYDSFATPATHAVLDCLGDLDPTTSRRLTDYVIEDDKDVAVIGIDELTPLERSVLPDTYTSIDLLAESSFEPPGFRIYDSATAIVDTVIDSITADNADRVAIVLDSESRYSSLVEASLEAADLPFYGGPGFNDLSDHRAFLRLLRASQAGSDIGIAAVKPLLERMGAAIESEHDEKRLRAVDLPAVEQLTALCDDLHGETFEAAAARFESVTGASLEAFCEELEDLGLLSSHASADAIERLEFYLQTYEVPVDRHNDGVLLADAKAAATVDRPAVFYLGMDDGWTHAAPQRPWVDSDQAYTRNIHQFQRLLQNGTAQYYLVQDTRGGRPVVPCLYFEELFDGSFDRFSDLESTTHARSFRPPERGFDHEGPDVRPKKHRSISQSSLNRFVNCPRDLLFSRLVEGPDRAYFEVGNLFHDFAEVYANHPDRIDEEALEEVTELMIEATRPFAREVDEPPNRTRYRIGLETIAAFLDENDPCGAAFLTPDTGWGTNVIAEHLDLPIDTAYTEWWFDDDTLGLKGKVDLVLSPIELVDYKSGSRDSARQVVSKSAHDPPSDTPNFQALLYLTYHRSQVPDERLEFTFFHFLETLDDAVAGRGSLEDCLTTITCYPVPFDRHIAREAVFEDLCTDGSGDCRKTLEQVSYADYERILAAHAFPATDDRDELLASPLGQALHGLTRDVVGDYKYVRNGCKQLLGHLRDIRNENFFADDLDAFESFVDERIAELNRYRAGEERFPVEGMRGEPNYRRVDHRDMILEGDA